MKKQKGFTLIELIVVMVILGILVAFAIPKYMELDKKARIATLKGLEAGMRSGSALVRNIAELTLSQDNALGSGNTVEIATGTTVQLVNGTILYPNASADGIGLVLQDTTGFTAGAGAGGIIEYTKDDATTEANCKVTYDMTGTKPDITTTESGC